MTSKPGSVCLFVFTLVELNPLVDLVDVGAVVGDGGLDQAQEKGEVIGGGLHVAVIVAHDLDYLPNVHTRADQASPSTARAVNEPHQRVIIHAQPLLDVSLGKRT